MSQLSHKHLLLNYGVCVCRDESECETNVCGTKKRHSLGGSRWFWGGFKWWF